MPIDIHAHYVPHQLIEAVKTKGAEIGIRLLSGHGETPAIGFDYGFNTRPLFPKLIEPGGARRKSLDRQGLDRQLLATWPDMYGYGLASAACAAWHRLLNGTLAEWCADNADRFSWVASVPLFDERSAAEELARAANLGAVALMLPSNVEGTNIGELRLEALWEATERLAVPIILHPVLTMPSPRSAKFGLTQIVQYTFDTTLGVGSLMMSGLLDRHPKLTLILSHGGGALPYLAGRFDVMAERMDVKAQCVTARQAPSDYMMRMAYDTIVHSPKVLCFLADTVGLDRVLIGTDESFPPADHAPIESLRSAGFSDKDIRSIGDENPRRLIPRLK
jgi:aminocarboxymuconate-semialdehyde decarboxylase